MNSVASLLLADRRASLIQQVERAVLDDGLVAAFAYFWISPQVLLISPDTMIARAMAAKGAARTYRDTAVLGYAIVRGFEEPEIKKSFLSGLQQLAGRDFNVAGTPTPVCDDCIGLLGLSLGMRKLECDASLVAWMVKACQISLTRQNAADWDRAVTILAEDHANSSPVRKCECKALYIAAQSCGLAPIDCELEQVAIEFLTDLQSQVATTSEEAICSLAALDWLRRSSPTIDLKTSSIVGVCNILKHSGVSLHRWVFEEKAKTRGGTPRCWHIDNEYHVQSLLWAILSPVFPDLREEEWLMSVGQKKPRADLCILSLRLLIEVKFIRQGDSFPSVIEEIAADSALYLAHGSPYSSIIAFIWDNSASTDQHHVLARGVKSMNGIVDVFIQSRPSRFNLA